VGLALARVIGGRTGRTTASVDRSWLLGRDRWVNLGMLAVGVAIVVVLTALPAIGWLFRLVVVLLGLGALWLAWRSRRTAPAAVSPESTPPPPSGAAPA